MSESDSQKTFHDLGLRDELLQALTALGYEAPTPIQERTIPLLLEGRDIIGQAQTGTGKTAAFTLPLLQRIEAESNATQALVLTPTRELAMQVAEAIHSYSKNLGHITVLPVYGGAPIVHQLKRLDRGVQIVVGTPGRLIDHLDRGSLDLTSIRTVVLDEADEMLKMGFIDEVERILSVMPAERQIALFSATMPDEVLRIANRHLRNPERVEIEHKATTTPAIEQRFLNISEGQKLDILTKILELEPSEAVLVFRRTKTGAAELAEKLDARGFAAEAMHGDMTQQMRESVVRRLRAGQLEIVVATDVAARGLDVEQIQHVVNYDIPYDVEAYVHRIGRTGRAGRTGMATLFITPRERRMMREIERFTGTPIKPMKIPTTADVAAKRTNLFKETLRKTVAEGELELYLQLVEEIVDEGNHDMAEVAAAAARLANSSRSLQPEREAPVVEAAPTFAPRPPQRVGGLPARPRTEGGLEARRPIARAPREEGEGRPPRRDFGGEGKVTLSMQVGKRDGVRPADIVGSIANEADVPGREIGPIEIREQTTLVGIPAKYQEQVLEKLGRAMFRGRKVNVRVADAQEAAPRESTFDRARKAYGKRDFEPRGERPARSFAGKPKFESAGERPKRFSDRDTTDERPKRYADRAPRAGASDERPKRYADRAPRAAVSDERPKRYADRTTRPAGREERPKRFDDRPARPSGTRYGSREERPNRPVRSGEEGSRPERKGFYGSVAGKPRRPAPGGKGGGPKRGR